MEWSGVEWSGAEAMCCTQTLYDTLYDTVWLSPPKLTATHEKRTPELGAIVYPCSPPEVPAPGVPRSANPIPNQIRPCYALGGS